MRLPVLAAIVCCAVAEVACISNARPVCAQSAPAMPAPATAAPLSPPAKADVILPDATITVDYSAPSVRGRAIFGGLVPYGEVWRTGANAATTLKSSGNLQIGDLNVPAGTYTLYSLPTTDGWKLIVNKQTGQWGTVYDKTQDLGRVTMSTGSNSIPVETMVIDFEKTTGDTAEMHVKWAGVDAFVLVTAVK